MNIGLIGYGRMGKLSSEAAESRGHTIIKQFNSKDPLISTDQIENIECLIDFSVPDAIPSTISIAVEANVNIVVGTTGWDKSFLDDLPDLTKSALFVAANFSIGVNLFRLIVKNTTKLLDSAGEYDVAVNEIHHKMKLDSPSGTALRIAEDIISRSSTKNNISTGSSTEMIPGDSLRISSERINDVIGVHEIMFDSEIDSVLLRHEMKDRNAFAAGALTIAEWLKGRSGIIEFDDYLTDVFGINGKD